MRVWAELIWLRMEKRCICLASTPPAVEHIWKQAVKQLCTILVSGNLVSDEQNIIPQICGKFGDSLNYVSTLDFILFCG